MLYSIPRPSDLVTCFNKNYGCRWNAQYKTHKLIFEFRGEFNTGHSGAVGFIECGDKKLGVGVLSGPNLSKDKYNEEDVYVDSLLTGFSPPVIKWLRQALPETAMPPSNNSSKFYISK